MNNQIEKEEEKKAARKFIAQKISVGFEPEALHYYDNECGEIIFYVMRLKNPKTGEKDIKPFYKNAAGKFVFGRPKFSEGTLLYNLSHVVQNPKEPIWFAEGEKCVDHLRKLGFVSTTSGGAQSIASANLNWLEGSLVIIWADNDPAGYSFREELTKRLQEINCIVEWVDITQLNLDPKEDCVDWILHNPKATKEDIEKLPRIAPDNIPRKEFSCKATHTEIPISFKLTAEGLFFVDDENETIICSPLTVTAMVCDHHSENWGRLLQFKDADGKTHTWAMPCEMLKSTGEELIGELLRLGLHIFHGRKVKSRLLEYIMSAHPSARVTCVNRSGWHNNVFVLPGLTIGQNKNQIVYQSNHSTKTLEQSGTLAEWQQQVSYFASGNSRLLLSISIAFASMLLYHAGAESGGIHFVGESSCGKTTALRVAASVYGGSDYLNRWRATTNGLEGLAVSRCDNLLILDELSQVDPKEAGEIAYMLANGSGKTRANKAGDARARNAWRLLFLSAGEIGLGQHMNDGGKKAKAGQEIRLVDIPADAGMALGIFEVLHHFPSGSALSSALNEASQKYYGTAAIAFLEEITLANNLKQLPLMLKSLCENFVREHLPKDAGGQVIRVCERFAIIAAAGEMATHFGITGWGPGEADKAAAICFNAWLEQRGSASNKEEKNILRQIKSFFEQHGESRFSKLEGPDSKTINRVGFYKQDGGEQIYYVLPEAFKNEVCKGLEYRGVIKILLRHGWLNIDSDGKAARKEALPGMKRSRCYVFNNKMWGHEG